ncbi:hypothetical protein [Anaeromicrobium sediminis]|uniref:DUF8052 domain-containing protein n=1 Tax=Anaeromicrobium sediminis TaxID=1478221 RepID=A0A267MFG8_9FIRM|nr:hypothetical protein [Anaeromicrobium sediminis]PAB57550.1 hypothetical protein CCE28_18790 [Anaeromicrobium sediminis]
MEIKNYISSIENRLNAYFDINRNYFYDEKHMNIMATHNCKNSRYFMSKRVNIYSFENNEVIFLKDYEHINLDILNSFIKTLESSVDDFVTPSDEHMSTDITGVLVVGKGEIDEDLIKRVKKYKFYKSFMFGFKGWVNIKLILVNVNDKKIITNKKGKGARSVYDVF